MELETPKIGFESFLAEKEGHRIEDGSGHRKKKTLREEVSGAQDRQGKTIRN